MKQYTFKDGLKIVASCKEEAIQKHKVVASSSLTQLYRIEWKDKYGDRYKEYYDLANARKKMKEMEGRDDIEWIEGPTADVNIPKVQNLINKYNAFMNKVKKTYDMGKASQFHYNQKTANSTFWEDDTLNDGIFWIDNFSAGVLSNVGNTSKKTLLLIPVDETIKSYIKEWKGIADKMKLNVELKERFDIGNGARWSNALVFSNK